MLCPAMSRPEHIAHSVAVAGPGMALEFGVASGFSLRLIAAEAPDRTWGFDSFRGLPDEWRPGAGHVCGAGSFRCPVPRDIHDILVVGRIEDTLPAWMASHTDPIAFVHFDLDLYGPTRFGLSQLNDRIGRGCILRFDELCAQERCPWFTAWREHEYRALCEWQEECRRTTHPISRDGEVGVAVLVD